MLLFHLEWGPDRIKRKFIVKDLSKGGFRMLQIEHFIIAQKYSPDVDLKRFMYE